MKTKSATAAHAAAAQAGFGITNNFRASDDHQGTRTGSFSSSRAAVRIACTN